MILSLFNQHHDNVPKRWEVDWSEFLQEIRTFRFGEKFGPAWSPAEYEQGLRADENVARVHALVFDFDGFTAQETKDVFAKFDASELSYVAHSSASHWTEKDWWCFRIVVRLTEPVPARHWRRFWRVMRRELELPEPDSLERISPHSGKKKRCGLDGKCDNESRLYFLPTLPTSGSERFTYVVEGLVLPTADVLAYPEREADTSRKAEVSPKTEVEVLKFPERGNLALAPVVDLATDLDAQRKRLSNELRKNNVSQDVKALIRNVLDGKPLVEGEGARNDSLFRLAGKFSTLFPDDVPDEALLELVRKSVNGMDPDPAEGPWMEVFYGQLRRNREAIAEERRATRIVNDAIEKRMRRASAVVAPTVEGDDPEAPYPAALLEKWAEQQGCSVEELKRRLILQKGQAFYVFENGTYSTAHVSMELPRVLRQKLARAPVQLAFPDANGNFEARSVNSLLDEHCTVVDHTVAAINAPFSFYDEKTRTFTESVARMRTIEPKSRPEVRRWLELFAGNKPKEFFGSVAALFRHDRPTAAVYVIGPKGTGKSFFAGAVAKLWERGTTVQLGEYFESFNAGIAESGVLIADEYLRCEKSGVHEMLRDLVSNDTHRLRRKGLPNTSVQGHYRVWMFANHEHLLAGDDKRLGLMDAEADGIRLVHIRQTQDAADYLRAVGGRPTLEQWARDGWIEQELAAIAQEWKFDELSRFLVEGNPDDADNRAGIVDSSGTSLACEWVVNWASRKDKANNEKASVIRVGGGNVLLNAQALSNKDHWDAYISSTQRPLAVQTIGRMLTRLSKNKQVRVNGQRFHCIDANLIVDWADRNGVGDPESLRELFSKPMEVK